MCLRERPNIFLRNKEGFFYSMHHQNNIFCSFSFRPKQHYIHHMLNALFYNKILNYKDNIIKVILNLCLNIVCTLIFIKNCLNFFSFICNTCFIHPLGFCYFFAPLYYTLHLHFSNLITV